MEAKGIIGQSLGVLVYGLPVHEPLVFEFPTSKLRSMYNITPYDLVCEYFDGEKRWGVLKLPRFTVFSLIQVKCDKVIYTRIGRKKRRYPQRCRLLMARIFDEPSFTDLNEEEKLKLYYKKRRLRQHALKKLVE